MSIQPIDKNSKGYQAVIAGTQQTVSVGAGSTQSSAFATGVRIIRVFSTQDCFLKFGSDPTATTSDCFCAGGIYQYYGVQEGWKVAAIRSSSSGSLYICEGGP